MSLLLHLLYNRVSTNMCWLYLYFWGRADVVVFSVKSQKYILIDRSECQNDP